MCSHYPGSIACLQKIEALASRSVTQARDVFDLHLLWSEERMRQIKPQINPQRAAAAAQNTATLSFDHFKSQVIPYLQPDDQSLYDSPDVWEHMQIDLMEKLENLA
jgi:hypothetical protein